MILRRPNGEKHCHARLPRKVVARAFGHSREGWELKVVSTVTPNYCLEYLISPGATGITPDGDKRCRITRISSCTSAMTAGVNRTSRRKCRLATAVPNHAKSTAYPRDGCRQFHMVEDFIAWGEYLLSLFSPKNLLFRSQKILS